MSSVLDRLLKSLQKIGSVTNLSRSLFIGIPYLTAISGAFVATGASSTIYTFGIFSEVFPTLNYVNWIYLFGPPILLFIVILWFIFLLYFPPENISKKLIVRLIEESIKELGPVSLAEKKVMGIMALTLLLWITQNIHGYSIPLIGLLGASLTIMPIIGVWKWDKAKKSIDWDMMVFFASTLMVSGMLIKTGTVDWIATYIVSHLSTQPSIIVLLLLVLCTAILRIIFVNVLGFLTIMNPLALTVGQNMDSFSPLVVAMAVFLTGIPGFFLITQSPVHLISFSYGYFSERDLFKIGFVSMLIWLLLIFCTAFFYWNIIL